MEKLQEVFRVFLHGSKGIIFDFLIKVDQTENGPSLYVGRKGHHREDATGSVFLITRLEVMMSTF